MLSIESYIESDKLLYQVGELRPGFLDKDTSLIKGPSPEGSFYTSINESKDENKKSVNTFKLIETTHPKTGEKLFFIE